MCRSFRRCCCRSQGNDAGEWTLAWYGELMRTPLIVGALRTTALVAAMVALLTPLLALLAAQSIRELGFPRLILLAMLLPLFIPGVTMGLATGFLFRFLGLPPSLPAIVIVQMLWALPFATLIILTVMSTFDPVYLEAAYMSGAGRWQAFRDIELPLIAPGIFGAASFSLIISINETVRTSIVQGRFNTVATYIWSTYRQIGLSPVLYALMGLIILATMISWPPTSRSRERRGEREPDASAFAAEAAGHDTEREPGGGDDPGKLHGRKVGALVYLELLLAAQLLEHLRHLLRRVGHMNETARNRRGVPFGDFKQAVKAGIAQVGARRRRQPHRNVRCEQGRLDFAHRQGREARAGAVAQHEIVAQQPALIVGDLEVGEIDADAFDADRRFPRPQPKPDHRRGPELGKQSLDARRDGCDRNSEAAANDLDAVDRRPSTAFIAS